MSQTWGVMIQYSCGSYYSFLFDGSMYAGIKALMPRHNIAFIAGKNGISAEEIGKVEQGINEIVKRLNANEQVDLKKELEQVVKEPEIAKALCAGHHKLYK